MSTIPTLGQPTPQDLMPASANMGAIQAQIIAAQRQQQLAQMLIEQGYVKNSGAVGAIAQIASAWKGKKLDRKAGESVADALKRKFEEESRIAQAQAKAAADAKEFEYQRKRTDDRSDLEWQRDNRAPAYRTTDDGIYRETPQGLVPAEYAQQGGQPAPQGPSPQTFAAQAPQGNYGAILDEIGQQFNFRVTDGLRTPQQNRNTPGSAPNSRHMLDLARDYSVIGKKPSEVQAFVDHLKSNGFHAALTNRGTGPHIHAEYRGAGGGGGGSMPSGPIRGPGYTERMTDNARADEALGLSKEANARAAAAAERAKWGNPPAGMRFDDKGNAVPIPGVSKAGAASEDERKAVGWLDQAQNAFNNMEKAIESDPDASQPTAWEVANNVADGVVPDAFVNSRMGEGRQMYNQGSSSFSEAVLRAATGAGVNADEARQKVRELTPQPYDGPKVIQQKREAMSVYLDSLRSRSGRAIDSAKVKPHVSKAHIQSLVDKYSD